MKATVTCDSPEHLRALVNRLLADEREFDVYAPQRRVSCTITPDEPLYLELAHTETANNAVHFDFDGPEHEGRLTVTPGGYGPILAVYGTMIGYVDMFDAAAGNRGEGDKTLPPQLLLFCPTHDDQPMAKVLLDPDGKMVVIVHKDAEQLHEEHPRSIHKVPAHLRASLGADRIFKSVAPE